MPQVQIYELEEHKIETWRGKYVFSSPLLTLISYVTVTQIGIYIDFFYYSLKGYRDTPDNHVIYSHPCLEISLFVYNTLF